MQTQKPLTIHITRYKVEVKHTCTEVLIYAIYMLVKSESFYQKVRKPPNNQQWHAQCLGHPTSHHHSDDRPWHAEIQ